MKKQKREDVYKKYDGHCAYCGKVITYKEMQVDHHYPKRGASYAMVFHNIPDINAITNLMPSCRRCNHYKRAYKPEDFRRLIKTLHKRIAVVYINKVAVDYGIITIKPHDGVFYFEKYETGHKNKKGSS